MDPKLVVWLFSNLYRKYNIFKCNMQILNLGSVCNWADRFESFPKYKFSHDVCEMIYFQMWTNVTKTLVRQTVIVWTFPKVSDVYHYRMKNVP